MDNKQKRKLMTLIYKTITFFSILALGLVLYLVVDRIFSGRNNIDWLNYIILTLTTISVVYILIDNISTKKLTNKYKLANILYVIILTAILGIVTLCVYCYITKINILNHIFYILAIALVMIVLVLQIINFLIGLFITKLHRNSSITLNADSETPTFNDEINLKKRLDELNRKLSIKKIQDEIDQKEKILDE